MIARYKKISIIYGGIGKNYAASIEERLNKLHTINHIPIKVSCLNTSWVSHEILNDVIETLENSDLILLIFTPDDVGTTSLLYDEQGEKALKKRLRQNVLIELGMALYILKKSKEKIKVIANFNKNAPDVDFPSDIQDALSMRSFTDETFDDIVEEIEKIILEEVANNATTACLFTPTRTADYENIFEELKQSDGTFKIKRLSDIRKFWYETLNSFDYTEEKFLYFMERIKTFPIFGEEEKVLDWFKNMAKSCVIGKDVDPSNKKAFSFVQDLINTCTDYTIVKSNPKYTSLTYEDIEMSFFDLYQTYQSLIKQGISFAPTIEFCLLEYYGLTKMRLYQIEKDEKLVDDAIKLYHESEKVLNETSTRFKLYEGYLTFNLGRAYYKKYELTQNEEYLDNMKHYFKKTLLIRKKWKSDFLMPDSFCDAMSYEYFYAKSEYLKIQKNLEFITKENLNDEIVAIVNEINNYICKDAELSKLLTVQKSCVNLKK